MVLKYSTVPVLNYGQQASTDSWRDRFPPRARPISEAPERSGTPIMVYEPTGRGHRAVHHLGRWMAVEVRIDQHTGERRTVMTGDQISNPVVFVSS